MTPALLPLPAGTHRIPDFSEAPPALRHIREPVECRPSDDAVALVRRFIAEHENDDERRGDAGCLECTDGTTPRHRQTGPCAYHAGCAFLSRLDSRR